MLEESIQKVTRLLEEDYSQMKSLKRGIGFDVVDTIVKEIIGKDPALNIGVVLTAVELYFNTFNHMAVQRLEALKKANSIFVEGTAAPVLALRINAVKSDAKIFEKKAELLERYFDLTGERFKGSKLDKEDVKNQLTHIREDVDALKEIARIGTTISPATQSLISSLERTPAGATRDKIKELLATFEDCLDSG